MNNQHTTTISTKKFRILITDRFALTAQALLRSQPQFEILFSVTSQPTATELHDVDGILIRSKTKIDADLLRSATKLKLIVSATSGFDHIDFAAVEERNSRSVLTTEEERLTVMHTPDANAQSAAELTWSLLLACARNLVEAHKSVKAGEWRKESLNGMQLRGKTYGIAGLGRIGKKVARIAAAFDMNVIAFDPFLAAEDFEKQNVTRVGFEEFLKQSDVLSFHVPATQDTHHMLHRSHFEYINRGTVLINTSRGQVIKEADLVEALEKGFVKAAGLDVFEKEPLARNSGLLKFPQVILTPHMGALTEEAFQLASDEAATKAIDYFLTGTATDTLPPDALWMSTNFRFDDE